MDPRIEQLSREQAEQLLEQALPYADMREPLGERERLLAQIYQVWRGRVLLRPDSWFNAEALLYALGQSPWPGGRR